MTKVLKSDIMSTSDKTSKNRSGKMKIKVYTVVIDSKRIWTMANGSNRSEHGYWEVVEYNGVESVSYHSHMTIMGIIPMPATFWLKNEPTVRDFS